MNFATTSAQSIQNHWVEASAPSNIALIKYMGKTDVTANKPSNSSLSYTLDKLKTFVRIKLADSGAESSTWAPYVRDDLRPIELSETGRKKFIDHLDRLKVEFKLTENFEIESANNFPSDCGLASSASSFAALTMAVYEWTKQNKNSTLSYRPKELSRLSQKGSGSSCRSFFSSWSLWHESGAEGMTLPYTYLKHQVLLCDQTVKSVSSSKAHQLVTTSDLFNGRKERAEERLKNLVSSLREQNWSAAYKICWNEFWDMHMLFHTSNPAFIYMNENSIKALRDLSEMWAKKNDGPLITMDAGSNIHLLYRPEQKAAYFDVINQFRSQMPLWTDEGYLEKL